MECNFKSIYDDAMAIWAEACAQSPLNQSQIDSLIRERGEDGLSPEIVARLLKLLTDHRTHQMTAECLIEHGTNLRQKLYGNKVMVMAPIEVSNRCASNCSFCGWRSSNGEMKRRTISGRAFLAQAEYLLHLGIRHIEIVGADDVRFVKEHMPELIVEVKQLAARMGVECEVSICTMALTDKWYRSLKDIGLDAVITWQETYDPRTYRSCILAGPKSSELDDNLNIIDASNGYLFRLESQARACSAGLQVGLGAMLGLATNLDLDIMSTIIHAQRLISNSYTDKPIIIGTPTLNTVVSKTVNAPLKRVAEYQHSHNDAYVALAALYLLSCPDRSVWVFPNCRIPKEVQAKAVSSAGYFTSTQVRLGPGGYLMDMLHSQRFSEKARSILKEEYPEEELLLADNLLECEQFSHHYHSHDDYCMEFNKYGIEVIK